MARPRFARLLRHFPPWLLLLAALAAGCSSSRPAADSMLDGRWYGLTSAGTPGVLEIEFSGEGSAREATFRTGPLYGYTERGRKGLTPLDARARVTLDERLGRLRLEEFGGPVHPGQFPNVLRAGAELYLGDGRGAGLASLGPVSLGQLGLEGWDGRQPTIAQLGNQRIHLPGIDVGGCVAFWRRSEFDDFVDGFEQLNPATGRRAGSLSKLAKLGGLLRGKPEIPDLAAWIEEGEAVASLERNRSDPLAWSVVPRFEGEFFERHFGRPFMELGPRRMDAIAEHIRNSFDSTGLKPWGPMFDRAGTSRPYGRGLGPADIAVGIAVREVLGEWAEQRGRALDDSRAPALDWAAAEETIAILEILGHTALASDDLKPIETALIAAASSSAGAELFAEFTEFEQEQAEARSLAALQAWSGARAKRLAALQEPEKSLFGERLDGFRAEAIQSTVANLRVELEALPTGVEGFRAGNAWNERFRERLVTATGAPEAIELRDAFLRRRADQADAVAAGIEAQLTEALERLPLVPSPATQSARLDAAANWYAQVGPVFALPEDRDLPAHEGLLQRMRQRARPHLPLLPPRLLGDPSTRPSAGEQAQCRESVPDDALPSSICPDPGFAFRSNVCWAIFHGRFDELSPALYQGDGMGAQLTGAITSAPARFHFAFAEFVRESSRRYGSDQIGGEMTAWWRTTNLETGEVVADNKHKVVVSSRVGSFYGDSCEIAEGAINVDSLVGQNFEGLIEALADPMGTVESMEMRSDGRIGMTTDWSTAISADIDQGLRTWPHHSTAEVQFLANLEAFLRGQPSLQAQLGAW